jgi:hypothetical protein
MSGVVPVVPRFKFFNPSTGAPLALGSVTVYEAGTTTLANTYQDRDLQTSNTNPVNLDANGECLFWVDDSKDYKFLLTTGLNGTGATVSGYPVDNIPSTGTSGFLQAGIGAVRRTSHAKMRDVVSAFDFMSDAERTDVLSGAPVLNHTVSLQKAIDHSSLTGRAVDLCGYEYIAVGLVAKTGACLFSAPRGKFAGSAWISVPVGTTNADVIGGTAPDAFGLIGVNINGRSGAGVVGVRLVDAVACRISHVAIQNCGKQGLWLAGSSVVCTVQNVYADNCYLDRNAAGRVGAIHVQGSDHTLSDIEATCGGSLAPTINVNKRYAAILLDATACFVSDCVAQISDIGLVVSGNFNRCQNIRADKNYGDGFRVEGNGNQFANCTAFDNSVINYADRAVAFGVDVTTTSGYNLHDGWVITGQSNTFTGCTCIGENVNRCRYGFNDSGQFAAAASRNQYPGCWGTGNNTALLKFPATLGSSADGPRATATGANGVTTLDATYADFFFLTGTGTLTTITGGWNGRRIRIIGNANGYVIKDKDYYDAPGGSNIRTGNAQKLVLRENRITELEYVDGVWYCTEGNDSPLLFTQAVNQTYAAGVTTFGVPAEYLTSNMEFSVSCDVDTTGLVMQASYVDSSNLNVTIYNGTGVGKAVNGTLRIRARV